MSALRLRTRDLGVVRCRSRSRAALYALRDTFAKTGSERSRARKLRPGEFLALVNSFGVVEIARAEQSAAEGLGLSRGAPVTVQEEPGLDLRSK